MIASLIKSVIVMELRNEAKKQINKDVNSTGKDDATGKCLNAVASAVDAVDLSTANKQTFNNIANAFEAAAAELRAQAAEL